jgi:DedD protein
MNENDTQLELKKRARRRLVGAVALAALAAIVLPMVMDQAPKPPPAQDIEIRIPAQDADAGGFTSRVLPAKPEAVPTPLPAAAPETATPPDPKPVEPKPADPKPAAKTEAAKPAAPPAAPAAGQWIVQLGAYRDEANVIGLTTKIKQQGYSVYTENGSAPDGSARTRVRAGPFPSKEAAEKARERIKRLGVDGVVAQK